MPDHFSISGRLFLTKVVTLPKKRPAPTPPKKASKRSRSTRAIGQEEEDPLSHGGIETPEPSFAQNGARIDTEASVRVDDRPSSTPPSMITHSQTHGAAFGLDNLEDLMGQVLIDLVTAFDFDLHFWEFGLAHSPSFELPTISPANLAQGGERDMDIYAAFSLGLSASTPLGVTSPVVHEDQDQEEEQLVTLASKRINERGKLL